LTKGINHTKFKDQFFTKGGVISLGIIPNDWDVKTINDLEKDGQIIEFQDGNHGELHPKSDDFTEKGKPFLTASHIDEDGIVHLSQCKRLPEHFWRKLRIGFSQAKDVLFTHNATVGRVAVLPDDFPDCIVGTSVTYYRLDEERLDKFYFSYILSSHFIIKQYGTEMDQTTRQQFSILKQAKLRIPLAPIHEQRKIASILLKVDSLIQLTQKIIEETQRLKKGLMQRLLTKGIGHTKYKKINLKLKFLELSIPDAWNVDYLENICEIIDTPHYTSPLFNSGVPVITTADCNPRGVIDYSNVNYTSKEEYLKRSKVIDPEKGDVLFTREAPLGISVLVDGKEITVGQRIILLKFDKEIIDGKFLVAFLNSHTGIVQSNSLSIKTTVERVNIGDIKQFKIPIPPIEEQKMITLILSNIDANIQERQHYESTLSTLKKGLMQKLLTGQIRVNV